MRIAWTLYQSMLFVLPLLFGGYENWAWPIYGAIYSFIVILIVSSPQKAITLSQKFIYILIIISSIQIWALTQYFLNISHAPIDSLISSLHGVGLVLFSISTYILLNSKERVIRALWIVAISAAFQSIYGTYMVISGVEHVLHFPKSSYIGTATGTYINRNHLAGYLEITIALTLGLMISLSNSTNASNWKDKIRYIFNYIMEGKLHIRILIIAMAIGLVMTKSRMGNTAMFGSLAATSILALLLIKKPQKGLKYFLASIIIIDIAIVGTIFGLDKVADRIANTSSETERRDEMNRDTFDMWLENSVLGVGAGAYEYTFPVYKKEDFKSETYVNEAHNDYLQFLSEYGLIAYIALLSVVSIALINSIQSMRKRSNNFNIGLGFGCTMAILSYSIHSSVDFNLQIPANAYMFCFVIVLSFIARWSKPGRREFYPPSS